MTGARPGDGRPAREPPTKPSLPRVGGGRPDLAHSGGTAPRNIRSSRGLPGVHTVTLRGTSITTTQLGFGCAGAFRLPGRTERRALIDAAYDTGFRHFDVAPMYGMGRAESELAPLLARRRDDVTVTTKFGIDVSAIGRAAGAVQMPVRVLLANLPKLGSGVQQAGRGPNAGQLGKRLYRSIGYSPESARSSLDRSLRTLGTDHVDIFTLHDPAGDAASDAPELIGYLDDQVRLGRIRCWGIAGDSNVPDGSLAGVIDRSPFLQFRDDLFDDGGQWERAPDKATMTFGAFGRALPALRSYFSEDPSEAKVWSDRLGFDVGRSEHVSAMLLREGLRRNRSEPVLFTTTRHERLVGAVEAIGDYAGAAFAHEHDALVTLAAAVRARTPGLVASDD